MHPAGFKLTIPASEQPQNHTFDRMATRIGTCVNNPSNFHTLQLSQNITLSFSLKKKFKMPKITNNYNFNYNSSKLSFFLLPKRHTLGKGGMRS